MVVGSPADLSEQRPADHAGEVVRPAVMNLGVVHHRGRRPLLAHEAADHPHVNLHGSQAWYPF